ncbi:MAG TPA: hypothetical protein VNO21_27300 [Polyangiaceae bacterium]|nr:hypothetical protein [Polyangiaceae bacterium]
MPKPNMTNIGLILAAAVSTALALPACQRSGQDTQEQVNSTERQAEQKADQAKKESTTKTTSAQTEVDQKVAQTTADFTKTRDEYRTYMNATLDRAEKKISRLEAKQSSATGETKAELDAALPDIRAKHDGMKRDMQQLESVTVANWDATKHQLDNDTQALKSALDKAPGSM